MVVQQHVLNWLYSVLTSEYHDVNRTYNDVAQVLSHYPSLSPRTDVHTFPNGASALLVHLSGTLPVVFRGTTYRFPISVWVPHAYPREAPLVYVTPTEHIMVRPGQHVDPQGQVYHPYLAGWSTYWDKSTILDFLAILRDVFAKEPPVIARPPQQQQQPQPPQAPAAPTPPPPVPPLPQELASSSPVQQDGTRPPPPPPKPGAPAHAAPTPHHQPSSAPSYAAAPPVPPHPPHPARPTSQYGRLGPAPAPQSPRPGPFRYHAPPPLPPHPTHQQQQQQQQPPQPPHGAPYQSPPPPGPAALPHNQAAPPQPPFSPMDPRRISTLQQQHAPQGQHYGSPPPPNWQQQQQQQQQHPPQAIPQHHQFPPQPQQPQPKPPPPPDLLDDDGPASPPSSATNPLTNLNGGAGAKAPPPPPPPNPEKDLLLQHLAETLRINRHNARLQNDGSLAGLQAQRQAMSQAANTLQSEYAQLSHLSSLLQSNTAILQESLRKADAVIENSKTLKEPDIDELLVAPTVVGNQLYELVAEERALADAIFVLGRAVERGRIAPGVHAKMVRGLAREWYLKKALVKKIGHGMGLAQ
ncbi:UEV domain-containing protein [Copromyces sp. CBS 386.78]|nr:UEV domain-containing protein [Copromyces sp. CBS 386.78]